MTELFDSFKKKVENALAKEPKCHAGVCCEVKLSLGVLLWAMGAVAGADGLISELEEKKINDILISCAGIQEGDLPVVMATVKQASIGQIDPFQLVADAGSGLTEEARESIIEILYLIAYADDRLDESELEVIQRAGDMFGLSKEKVRSIESRVVEG